jgi:hypothetical protein
MPDMNPVTDAEFESMLKGIIAQVGVKTLTINLDILAAYCGLTGHDMARYRKMDRVPAGYLMTFMAPLITEVFVAFFTAHPAVIKGVVHSTSRVELHAPFRLSDRTFRETVGVRQVETRSGRRGDSFVVDFDVRLEDARGALIAHDMHQFFLKK